MAYSLRLIEDRLAAGRGRPRRYPVNVDGPIAL